MSAHDAEATEVSDKRGDPAGFEPLAALDGLSAVGLVRMATGRAVSIAGEDPILPASHRLGACIGFPIMAAAVGSVVFRRHRGDPAQDLALDLRQAVHGISSGAFWHPTVNGEPPTFPLGRDNPFLLPPYQTREGVGSSRRAFTRTSPPKRALSERTGVGLVTSIGRGSHRLGPAGRKSVRAGEIEYT